MQTTLAHEIWPASQSSRMAQAVMVIAGTALLALSAKIQVPFWPVPMTMQTFVVLLLGITYGPRLGFATGFLYLLEGSLGLPVFAKGAGLAYLMGPTGGYLIGFVAAMTLMGFLANRGWDRKAYSVVGAMMIGEMIIFLPGIVWLAMVVGGTKAIELGLTPFLAAEAFKVLLAAVTLPLIWRALKR